MPHPNAPESSPTTALFDSIGSRGTGTLGLAPDYGRSTIPDLVLSTAFSDIRHSQPMPVILIVGFVASERLSDPSRTRNFGR